MVCKEEPRGAKPPLPGLVKIQYFYQNLGVTPINRAANVLHAQWISKVNHPLGDLTTAAQFLFDSWAAHVWGLMSSQWSMYQCTVQSLGGDGLVAEYVSRSDGTDSTVSLPPQAALCISWLSGITQRGGRGRTYLPGVPSDALLSQQGSLIRDTFSGAIKTGAIAYIENVDTHTIGGDSLIIGVPSYYSKCQLRAVPLFGTTQTAIVHDRLDTQRRRLGKESNYPVS